MLSDDNLPARPDTKIIATVYGDKIFDLLKSNPNIHMFVDITPLSAFLGRVLLEKNEGKTRVDKLADVEQQIIDDSNIFLVEPTTGQITHHEGDMQGIATAYLDKAKSVAHRKLFALIDNEELKVKECSSETIYPNFFAFEAEKIPKEEEKKELMKNKQPTDEDDVSDIMQQTKLMLSGGNSSVLSDILEIATHHARNQKSLRNTVHSLRTLDPALAGSIIFGGCKHYSQDFRNDLRAYLSTRKLPNYIVVDPSEFQQMNMSALQHKKAFEKKLSKLLATNAISNGQNTDDILELIHQEMGMSPDQLYALYDIVKNRNVINPKDYAKRVVDSSVFFQLADMNPNDFYDRSQRTRIVDPDRLNQTIFEDITQSE